MSNDILKKIIYNKIEWLKDRKVKQPIKKLQENISHSSRDFYDISKKNTPFFILEAKQYSPSIGRIHNTFDIKKICAQYKNHATAISILTDEKYFKGKFEFLLEAHQLVKQPILCKDFFIDPYQIYLARYYQADIILLMLSILNDSQYIILSNLAHSLNMSIITEINNKNELYRAIKLNAQIIGINNRNLHNLSININKTYELAPLIPKNKIIISESGIYNHTQVQKLKKVVHGFLIGSSIMKSSNITLKINSIIFGNNKICGLTRVKDAKRIQKLGAVYGGLIFVKTSIRKINIHVAKNIVCQSKLKYIGVFKNENIQKIKFIIIILSLYAIQLHGNENIRYIINIKNIIPKNIKIYKALDMNKCKKNIQCKYIDFYLFDNDQGGSGKCFDWSILNRYNLSNVFLSGGLSVKNCMKAMQYNCFGLDFNSKIETTPGIKNFLKMQLLFKKLKNL
ncbi:Tryptophan biosynthesis protein TrpCF [Buchnera aphidicola (Pterocallis alni)]|uniref:bifunctional indole-3-glycerol-phosphate synthase TrpC/phosphoribosylanthranilate isomerase TrpF n=1 Tax=Buchnera aphidicola TaxID=9 RepID=UPI0034649BF2